MEIKCLQVKDSNIYFESVSPFVHDYYMYLITILQFILTGSKPVNILVGNFDLPLENQIRIGINYEHTLVRKGGRDTEGSPEGKIPDGSDRYLVRIDGYQNLMRAGISIDYSMPNIVNIQSSGLYDEFSKKLIYLPPFLYPLVTDKKERPIPTLTTFLNTEEPRRKRLLQKLKNHKNVNNCFDKDQLQGLYLETKILINIHQTDYHHTFEELRVLPALLCGCIVICEDSPLKETIPYSNFVIWSTYDSIYETIKEVQNNYSVIWNNIFGPESKIHDIYQHQIASIQHLKSKIDSI